MIIQRYGDYFLKISAGEKTIGVNPISKESNLSNTRFGADVTLIQAHHPDMNGVELMMGKEGTFVIKGPGEYEIQDIFVKGFGVPTKYDGQEGVTTIYSVLFDQINVVILGPVVGTEIPESAAEELYSADIIFVPISGGNTLEADEAFKMIKKFSPRIVIPLAHDKASLDAFVSNFGESAKAEEKITLKKKDVEGEQMDVMVLKDLSK